MELIGIWLEAIANFIAALFCIIIYLLGFVCYLVTVLISKVFFLTLDLPNLIFHVVDNGTFKTWIQLLTPLTTPIALIYIAKTVTERLERDKERKQIEDKRQAILTDYLKQMTTLLVDKEMSNKNHEHPTVQAAKALTITTIRELDSKRIKLLTNFLVEANLIRAEESKENSNLPSLLKAANLENLNLEDANLENANLEDANLKSANLKHANLFGANLDDASLNGANLCGVVLYGASLSRANLDDANLNGVNFCSANLNSASFNGASLCKANFYGADLNRANLCEANFYGANLNSANLKKTNFTNTNLEDAKVKKAKFGNNQGIDEQMKADLISRGAIFE